MIISYTICVAIGINFPMRLGVLTAVLMKMKSSVILCYLGCRIVSASRWSQMFQKSILPQSSASGSTIRMTSWTP